MPTNFIHKSIATVRARLGNQIYDFEAMLFYCDLGWNRNWFLLNNHKDFGGSTPSNSTGWDKLGYKNSWCIGRDWTPGGDDIISIKIKPQGFFTRKLNYAT